jgi:hypothetical protein
VEKAPTAEREAASRRRKGLLKKVFFLLSGMSEEVEVEEEGEKNERIKNF